jgi:hypothetical protein
LVNQGVSFLALNVLTRPTQKSQCYLYIDSDFEQSVIHDISLEKFEEHFKNLTSKYNAGDINHDTTETVFDELDRPFDENELNFVITKLKRDKDIGVDNIMNEYIYINV